MSAATSIGRFRIEATLGGGSFGTVYRAHDPLVGELVAIKVLRPELGRDSEQMERLRREVVLARRVDHPGVCRIHDLQKDGETLFVVMELVDGETLDNLCARGPLPPLRAVRIIEQVCRALVAAHAVGVLHRDIKPSNVMVKANGDVDDVKLVDFGIATTQGLDHLTKPGVALGTVGYLAPELWEGDSATPATDVFATGVMLYGALTGRLPWRAVGLATLQQMRSVPVGPPSIFAAAAAGASPASPAVDAGLDGIVLRAIAPDAPDRYASALALADALAAWRMEAVDGRRGPLPVGAPADVSDTTPVPTVTRSAGRSARARIVTAVAAALVACVLIAATSLLVNDAEGGAGPAPPVLEAPVAAPPLITAAALAGARASQPAGEASAATLDTAALLDEVEAAREPAREAVGAPRRGLAFDEDTKRTMGMRVELAKLVAKRGLIAGDVAAVDVALRLKIKDGKAPAALAQALAEANAVVVDRAFVERKLARLQSRAGSASSQELDGLASGIAADISARRYVEANAQLNRALALLR